MLCGDESNSAVIDLGTSCCRFGASGQNAPSHVFRSDICEVTQSDNTKKKLFGDEVFRRIRPEPFDVHTLLDSDSTQKWDDLEKLLNYGFQDRMRINPKEYTFLVSQGKHFNDVASQEKLLEIGLESIQAAAVFTIPDSILNSLCAGRGTSLVVDLGAHGTTITAVVDGYELKKAKLFTPIGGNAIDQAIANYLYEQKYPINPLSSLYGKSPIPASICSLPASSSSCYHPKYSYSSFLSATKLSKSYLDLLYYDILKDIKGWMSFIPHYSLTKEVRSNEGLAQVGVYLPPFYELPDGTQIPSSYRLSTLVEGLFFPEAKQSLHNNPPVATLPGQNTSVHYGKRARELIEWDRQQTLFLPQTLPQSQQQYNNTNNSSNSNNNSQSSSSLRIEEESLSDLIYLAVSRADVDVRKDLLSNIVLCGGTSLVSGLTQRLTKELTEMVPSNYKVKVISNLPIERQHSTWIGGSILSICGTFNPMWISKKEYEEYGAATLIRERFYF